LILATFAVFAQESAEEPSLFVTESTYYRVYSEISAQHAEETAEKLDAFIQLFNEYFRFDLDSLQNKLNVRIFADKNSFNEYLQSVIEQTKDNFVYLQFSNLQKSELVGFQQKPETYNTSLVRHGFIQFLKSFVYNPPPWMLKGFAIYFEDSIYDEETKAAELQENLSWLNTLKSIIRGEGAGEDGSAQTLISLARFFNPSEDLLEERPMTYHAQSWGFITFLNGSKNKEYNRLLWDAISVLQPKADLETNIKAIRKKTVDWVNEFLLFNDFKNYILSLKTFPDLVQDGISLYSSGDYSAAEEMLLEAILIDGSHYLPYYYLGLIQYAQQDYSLAEYYYQSARMLGADKALIQYALGVNAFADNRLQDAQQYLQQARNLKPDEYGNKASQLLERISKLEEKEAASTQGM
jgi:hypothetical protein